MDINNNIRAREFGRVSRKRRAEDSSKVSAEIQIWREISESLNQLGTTIKTNSEIVTVIEAISDHIAKTISVSQRLHGLRDLL